MRKFGIIVLTAAGLLVPASPLWAQDTPAANPAPAAAPQRQPDSAKENPDEVICRQGTPFTGSRLGARKVCHTLREWEEITRISQQNTKAMQDRQLGAKHGD